MSYIVNAKFIGADPFELADADTPEMLELLRQLRK